MDCMAGAPITPDFNIDDMSDDAALAMCALIGAEIYDHYLDEHIWRFTLPRWSSFSLGYASRGGAARSALRAYFFNINEFEEYRAIQLDRERRKEWKSNYGEHIRR